MAQKKRVLARREKPKIKPVRKKKQKKKDIYSQGKKCPDCNKPITNSAERCKEHSHKHRKRRAGKDWRKILLGDTELPGTDVLPTPCEICDQNPSVPGSFWCGPCQEAIDNEYLERSLTSKLRRGEKKELMVAA